MAEPSTIARPYAEAAFRLADAQGKLADWSAALANLSAVAADGRVRAAIGDPNFPAAKLAGLFISVLAGNLTAESENFVRVLAENDRLNVLVEIRAQAEGGRRDAFRAEVRGVAGQRGGIGLAVIGEAVGQQQDPGHRTLRWQRQARCGVSPG
mgnify:CR=1 FL=1